MQFQRKFIVFALKLSFLASGVFGMFSLASAFADNPTGVALFSVASVNFFILGTIIYLVEMEE